MIFAHDEPENKTLGLREQRKRSRAPILCITKNRPYPFATEDNFRNLNLSENLLNNNLIKCN